MYLLDTNIISESRRIPKMNAGVAEWLKQTPLCWPHPADRRRHRRNLRPPARP